MMKRKKSALHPELEELERQREALPCDIRELQIEHDLLKTASGMIKKELGGYPRDLSNRKRPCCPSRPRCSPISSWGMPQNRSAAPIHAEDLAATKGCACAERDGIEGQSHIATDRLQKNEKMPPRERI